MNPARVIDAAVVSLFAIGGAGIAAAFVAAAAGLEWNEAHYAGVIERACMQLHADAPTFCAGAANTSAAVMPPNQ